MDISEHQCKGCGAVLVDVNPNIDKCAGRKQFCELCLAQKNPRSKTEKEIKKRYFLVTAISAVIVLVIFITINWGNNKNDNFFEQLAVFGISYVIIWGFTSIVLLPVLMLMKKPHRELINKEKEEYREAMEEKKKSRQTPQC